MDKEHAWYCSLKDSNQVLRYSPSHGAPLRQVLPAVELSAPSSPNKLHHPTGIYVNDNLDVYIADTGNDRVQLIRKGQPEGRTFVGTQGEIKISLAHPTGLTMDKNGSLYILEHPIHRILRCSHMRCYCIIRCMMSQASPLSPSQQPSYLALNSDRNLLVLHHEKDRIRVYQFDMIKESCCKYPQCLVHHDPTLFSRAFLTTRRKLILVTVSFHASLKSVRFSESGRKSISSKMQTRLFLDSYNRPHLVQNATWKANVTSLNMKSSNIVRPHGIFISDDNRIHVADHADGKIFLGNKDRLNESYELGVFNYSDLFVGFNGEVYFENRNRSGQIDKWIKDERSTTCVAKFSGHCFGLFIDWNNSLYCSQRYGHKVTKISLSMGNHTEIIVAGNGSNGSAPHQLDAPWGIWVDRDFNLFVADAENNRIQKFAPGSITGITVAGRGSPLDLNLSFPTDVMLDGYDALYIADNKHHRVVRISGGTPCCIVGCTAKNGSGSAELISAFAIQFDREGNLYVADEDNHRIQKFEVTLGGYGQVDQRFREKKTLVSFTYRSSTIDHYN